MWRGDCDLLVVLFAACFGCGDPVSYRFVVTAVATVFIADDIGGVRFLGFVPVDRVDVIEAIGSTLHALVDDYPAIYDVGLFVVAGRI